MGVTSSDPFASDPVSAPVSRESIRPSDPRKVDPDIVPSAYHDVRTPSELGRATPADIERGAKGFAGIAKEAWWPKTTTQKVLFFLGPFLSRAGWAADKIAEVAPTLARGLEFTGGSGLGPAATRIGLQGAAGAATGAASGEGTGSGLAQGLLGGTLSEAPGMVGQYLSGLKLAKSAALRAMRDPEAERLSEQAFEQRFGMTRAHAQELAVMPTEEVDVNAPQPQGLQPVVGVPPAPPLGPGLPPPSFEAAARATYLQTPRMAGAEQLRQTQRVIQGAREAAGRKFGQPFERIYGPIGKTEVTPEMAAPIGQTAQEQIEWLESRGVETGRGLHPNVRNALNDLAGITNKTGDVVDLNTISKLRGVIQPTISAMNAPGVSGQERHAVRLALKPVYDLLDAQVPAEQKPALQVMKDNYAVLMRKLYGAKSGANAYFQQIEGADTLPKLGEALYRPEMASTTNQLIDQMDDNQRGLARQALASYFFTDRVGGKLLTASEIESRLQQNAAVVGKLWKGNDFAKIKTWRDMIIAQRKLGEEPPDDLPELSEFNRKLETSLRKHGMTDNEVLAAVNQELQESGVRRPSSLRYFTERAPLWGAFGYGVYAHQPLFAIPLGMYWAGHGVWQGVVNNPAMLSAYRDVIMNQWTQRSADAMTRLLMSGVNDAVINRGQPERQNPDAIRHSPPGPAMQALADTQNRQIAPNPGGADRAGELANKFEQGAKPVEVQNDLRAGRLAMDEIKQLLQRAGNKNLGAATAGVTLPDLMSATEVGTQEEKQMLIPLIQKRMQQELPTIQNKTLQVKLTQRFQKLQASLGQHPAPDKPIDTEMPPPPMPAQPSQGQAPTGM